MVPLNTPVSLGTMCISWCPGYSKVLLVALHTPWYLWVHSGCVTSQYPCISGYHVYFLVPWISLGTSFCLTHALVPLGTFGASWYVMVFVGISMTLWVSCVSLVVLGYSWVSFLVLFGAFKHLGNFRYLSVPFGTSPYL